MSRKKVTPTIDIVDLANEVESCRLCERMQHSARIFSHASGSTRPSAMFVGEAPGRLGADLSAIPFHGDVAGHNFESLLEQAGIDRSSIFVTNAVLCNPRDSDGNNATPNSAEIRNCNAFLKRQIDTLNPPVIVTLGANALRALALIEDHSAQLRNVVRTSLRWYGRALIPLYHPGRRAMIHRDFDTQLLDYRFVAKHLVKQAPISATMDPYALARKILDAAGRPLSYFALHKLFYLTELAAFRALGERLTKAYIIRQADGPYVTNLHIAKLTKHLSDLRVAQKAEKLYISLGGVTLQPGLFEEDASIDQGSDPSFDHLVRTVVLKYRDSTDAELKTAAYLTRPMRRILSFEQRAGRILNSPIQF